MATCCLLLVRVGVAPAAPAKAVSEVTEEMCVCVRMFVCVCECVFVCVT